MKIHRMSPTANSGEKHVIDDLNESFDSETGEHNQRLSSFLVIGSDGDDNDVSVTEDRSFGTEREDMALRATTTEQVSEENDGREDSRPSRSSKSSKARMGSSKDQRKFHNALKDEGRCDRHHPRSGNGKRSVGDEDDARRSRHRRDETGNHMMAVKEIEESRSCRGGDSNSSLHRHMKSEERMKESDASERSWRRRDEDLQGRSTRIEDRRKREHAGEIGSINGKRDKHAEKEEVKYNQREGSSHRKRERDNSSAQRKADENAKMRDDGVHNVRQRLEESLQRERGSRQIEHDEWCRHKQLHEESLPRKEREDKQSVTRSGRPVEEKTRHNHSQKSDDYKRSGREYQSRDVLRKTDHIESLLFPQDKVREDAYARGNRGTDDATRARFKRVDRNDIHIAHTSHDLRLYGRTQNKESEIGDHSSLISSKKNVDKHIGHTSEKVCILLGPIALSM